MADFLKRDIETPLSASCLAAGVRVRIETNSESVLAIARANLEQPGSGPAVREEIRLRIWVEEDAHAPEKESRPYFRGLGDLVFSGYGDRSSLLINLRDRCAAGRLTETLAARSEFWKTILFPSLIAIVGPSVGLTSLHSACVAWKGDGLLLAGSSGTGKSALSLALAQAGMDFLSDDRTLIGGNEGKLLAWGLSGEMKQRSGAVAHFPELKNLEHKEAWKGDSALRFDPVGSLGVNRVSSCEPRWIIFLERQSEPLFSLEEIAPEEAMFRLQQDLHQEAPETTARQRLTVEMLSRKACYVLRYGGNPHSTAGALRHLVLRNGKSGGGVSRRTGPRLVPARVPARDPLRRFRATCLRSDVLLMGKHIRIETDSPVVLSRVLEVFNRSGAGPTGTPRFLWRIVCEPLEEPALSWPPMTAFSDRTLRYISLGQRSFVAADLTARAAVGVLPEPLCEDGIGFSTVFLASMLHLSAPALGLTAISAACVAKGHSGLLLLGPPDSGKTTASYWAKKLGLEFHADQATFLELEGGTVRAWGDFWPAAFRPETARFLPELSTLGRSFTYRDRTFLCVEKAPSLGASSVKVTPAACIFLERHAASPPRLVPLSGAEVARQAFTDAGSNEDREAVFRLIGRLPAYRLLYDDDPYVAALFFRSVLDAHQLMEQRI